MTIRTTLRLAAYGAMACGLLFSSVQPAEARDKMTRKEKNTLIGVGIGALGGALLSKGDMWSTIAGAAAGGAIGNVTTKNRRDHHDDRRWDDDRYRDRDRRHWDR
jgi:osmotically inducible lipoprotein OsmB